MAEQTLALGNGEVFRVLDVADYVRAVRAVLDDPKAYTAVYDERPEILEDWSWERQAAVLTDLYTRVTGIRPEPRALVTLVTAAPAAPSPVPAGEPARAGEPQPVRGPE